MTKMVITLALFLIVSGCAGKTEVTSYDFSKRGGVYVVGFTADETIRRGVEDQIAADLRSRDMVAFVSYEDFPSLSSMSRNTLIDAANDKEALAVMVVNQVVAGEDGVIDNPVRITPEHPDLEAFYQWTKSVERDFDPDNEIFAEVNAFLIEGKRAKLVWSGTTWSFEADGEGGAISGISANIADELGQIRDALRAD